jgi:hypothetical protein
VEPGGDFVRGSGADGAGGGDEEAAAGVTWSSGFCGLNGFFYLSFEVFLTGRSEMGVFIFVGNEGVRKID